MRIWVIVCRKRGTKQWSEPNCSFFYASEKMADFNVAASLSSHLDYEYKKVAYVRELTGTDTLEGK